MKIKIIHIPIQNLIGGLLVAFSMGFWLMPVINLIN